MSVYIDEASTHTSTHKYTRTCTHIFIRLLPTRLCCLSSYSCRENTTGRFRCESDCDSNSDSPFQYDSVTARSALNFIWRLASRP